MSAAPATSRPSHRSEVTFQGDSRPFKSLNLRLLTTILVVGAFFSLLATVIQLYTDYQMDLELLDERVHAIEKSHLPALSLAIWSLDSPLIETQLSSMASLPDIAAIRLSTKYGEEFSAGGMAPDANFRNYLFQLYNQPSADFLLGDLTVQSDIGKIHERVWGRFMVIFVTQGVRTFFVSIAILLIVQFLVTRHLSKVAHYLGTMRLTALDRSFDLERPARAYRDELDTFVHAINEMRYAFKRDVQLLEEVHNNLRRSEEKYRLAMEATQDGLWDWDLPSGEVYYSPGWVYILGLASVANRYESWEERIHPDDRAHVQASLATHLEGKNEVWQQEHRLYKADGGWVWVLGRGRVVKRDPGGRPLRMIGTLSDIQNKKSNEEIIWQQANYDSLTGLPNRKLAQELLEQEVRHAERDKGLIWLLFLDLDGFKEVNDTLGHDAGDRLLQEVANRIQGQLRRVDTVARLGGDEFVVVLTQTREVHAVDQVASKLVEEVGRAYTIGDETVHVTTSIGIANYPNDADNTLDLLKFADQSMYAAKKEGKNRYVYFTPAMQSASLLRKQLSADLRRGMQMHHFRLYFQPILELRTGKVKKAEALLRWRHPEKGKISPAAFIPIAEDTGVILELGAWVFEQAFGQLRKWLPRHPDLQLSINLSPLQIKNQSRLCDQWLERLAPHSLRGDHIVVEITERLLLNPNQTVKERLLRYRDEGIQVAIGDFGTGYSALSYLKDFDIDYLKIGRPLTSRLATGSNALAIANAIIAMAHELNLEVIAEGVETPGQRELLRAMECEYGQGFLFSRPLPAEEFERDFL